MTTNCHGIWLVKEIGSQVNCCFDGIAVLVLFVCVSVCLCVCRCACVCVCLCVGVSAM